MSRAQKQVRRKSSGVRMVPENATGKQTPPKGGTGRPAALSQFAGTERPAPYTVGPNRPLDGESRFFKN